MTEPLYLRHDVQVEPLVDQWYAWSHLIAPATAARNLTHRHFRIMDSYLRAPQVHANATRNPALLGGPFVDYQGTRVDEIRALRAKTARDRRLLVELSAALAELDRLLCTRANGLSLHALYPETPALLRGYVELVYDLHHHASIRLIEPLLYRSPFYDRRAQSLMLSITSGDDRPFVMSTPRLESPGTVQLGWSFDDPRLDRLFALKTRPLPWAAIRQAFDLAPEQEEPFRQFLTVEPPAPYQPYDGHGVRWRYFGHACILIETQGVTILLDPVLSYTYESGISRYTYDDLPDRIDCVLVTHNHQDHVLLETLLQIRHKVGAVVVPRNGSGALQDPSLKLALEAIGFRQVRELGELDSIAVGPATITGLPFFGEHSDLAVATKLAYLVRLGREQILFAADSCNIEPMLYEHVSKLTGPVGTLFIGMECEGAPMSWLYGPLFTEPVERAIDQSRRLNGSDYEKAAALVDQFGCRQVYVYAMGQEPWLNHVMSIKYTEQSRPIVESNRLLQACAARGLAAERLFGEKEILLDDVEVPC